MIGRRFHDYEILELLGAGGMAAVYLAQDLKHRRRVAVKVMSPEVAAAIGPERFLREIEIAARLSHPHILPLFDSGESEGKLYYVTPFIAGETLRARLDRERRIPLDESVRLAREIASALGHAHDHGLVHRDIKPENILLADGVALVADFGIARGTVRPDGSDATRLATTAGVVLGTPGYMSPEQITGGEVDGRSDLYALACVLYEMLAGSPPFRAATPDRVLRRHVTDRPESVEASNPSVPAAVGAAVAKGLAKEPSDRYPTAARFAEALTVAARSGVAAPPAGSAAADLVPSPPNNLPSDRTTFVGRERELEECERLLRDGRLLTLTGIGGCGKSRLALKVAKRLLAGHPDGAWIVDIAPLADPARLYEAIAWVLGAKEEAGTSPLEAARRFVRDKSLLLVLDNCEHLLSACAEAIDSLLAEPSAIRILSTSREGLGVEGERIYALRSLSLPPPEAAGDLRLAADSDAIRLWVDRARAVVPGYSLDAAAVEGVVDICRRLDGIPLAIELAAGRLRLLSVAQIRSKLDDRFRLLAGGSRSALSRHQTLRATIQWSYDQLTEEERRMLRWLSIFAGGWSLDRATAVAGDAGDEFQVLEILGRLVEKSLVVVDREDGGEPRYRLLESVRQYGLERLAEEGETDAARDRHLSEYLALAERAYADRIEGESRWAPILEAERDNLRAALAAARETAPERHLDLTGALGWFWAARSHLREGSEHLAAALAHDAARVPSRSRARALWGAAAVRAWQGRAAEALAWMEEAGSIWRELGDLREAALALEGVGWTEYLAGNEEAARHSCEESLRLQRETGDAARINRARVALAQMLVALGRLEETRTLSAEILDYAVPRGDRRSEHYARHYLADCALQEESYEEAARLYRDSLALALAIGDRLESTFEIQGVAMALSGQGRAVPSLRLAGAVESEWERLGADIHVKFWDRLLERHLGAARRSLGEQAAAAAWAEGRALTMEAAAAAALDEA